MTQSISSTSLICVILALAWSLGKIESSPAQTRYPYYPTTTTTTPPAPTTINESPFIGVIDDPTNSATTSENTDELTSDDICVRCYDTVQIGRDMVKVHENITRKLKKLFNRKKAAADAAEASEASANLATRSNKVNRSTNSNLNSPNSTFMSRSLLNQPGLIVVSRLRVARSTANNDRVQPRSINKDKYRLNKKDPELERLTREQQRQKDITCKALLEVQNCLDQSSRECVGNLQYHSWKFFSDQSYEKLRCPYPNNPNIRPMLKKMPSEPGDDDDEIKAPVARPISSPEAVKARLWEILPSRVFPRPDMTILEPNMADPAVQKQRMQSVEQPKGFYRQSLSRPELSSGDYSINVNKILLVPCCFAILIAMVAALHYNRLWERQRREEEEEEAEREKRNFH